jgi:hypothetical protein
MVLCYHNAKISRCEVVSTFEGWQPCLCLQARNKEALNEWAFPLPPCFLLVDGHRVRLQNTVYIIWLTDNGQSVNTLILLFLFFNLSLPNIKNFIVLVIWYSEIVYQ